MLRDKKRITVMMDGIIQEKLRNLQARRIKKTKKNCSFSQIVNLVLAKALEHEDKVVRKILNKCFVNKNGKHEFEEGACIHCSYVKGK